MDLNDYHNMTKKCAVLPTPSLNKNIICLIEKTDLLLDKKGTQLDNQKVFCSPGL